ncbi:hypothetical protein PPEP_a1884 [Pseudoalteromonas peptidolytica F12-50-A1]|uniref:Uncharacterized protein n=1 Tax=Pseudoalteromonas peptidolytica F12-50-A1 TaxID=1315280 RepID=A0A8I0MWZ4_9GAMM|nr:hypothetical protein [Pseudoalteromonas peptidolytica F12-50-A1]
MSLGFFYLPSSLCFALYKGDAERQVIFLQYRVNCLLFAHKMLDFSQTSTLLL